MNGSVGSGLWRQIARQRFGLSNLRRRAFGTSRKRRPAACPESERDTAPAGNGSDGSLDPRAESGN